MTQLFPTEIDPLAADPVRAPAATGRGSVERSTPRHADGTLARARVSRPSRGVDVRIARHPYRLERQSARRLKRGIDVLIAVPMVLAALFVLPVLALIVRLESPGPALFSQERVGRGNRHIRVFKLRSMYADAEDRLRSDPVLYEQFIKNGYKLPKGKDPRITRVGAVLRKSSLDELPQVFSVLAGTMSIVGPRPVVPEELAPLYGPGAEIYFAAKPGLTGLWQVSGRSELRRDDRTRLDFQYIEQWSPTLDLKILVRTVPAVLTGRGAH
jgi:lipopolysaccharide/colanic/teichoic acid biosynthesis glycosyltransferase